MIKVIPIETGFCPPVSQDAINLSVGLVCGHPEHRQPDTGRFPPD